MESVFQVCKFVHETAAKDPLFVFDAFGRQLASQEPLHPEKRIIDPTRNRKRQ